MQIATHKNLANHIQGKSILHLNSLGKDSVICLEWLANYAKPKKIISVNFDFMASHPLDDVYFRYLQERYPSVQFLRLPDCFEVNRVLYRVYQSPIDCLGYINHEFEYYDFDFSKYVQEIRIKYGCDFSCWGHSKYESVTRASNFYKKGLVQGDKIYPIGMMEKSTIIGLIESTGVKLHPVYSLAKSTLDFPAFWKMRNSIIAYPELYEKLCEVYPLYPLERFRYEKMLNN